MSVGRNPDPALEGALFAATTFRRACLLALLTLLLAAGCRYEVPASGPWILLANPAEEPAPGQFVPVPGLVHDENHGFTYGLMPVWVVGRAGDTQAIVAPSVTYSDLNGLLGTLRFYRYLGGDAGLVETILAQSTEGACNYRALWRERRLAPGLEVAAQARHHRDRGGRFFGFGERTHESDETSYLHVETSAFLSIRYEVFPGLSFAAAPTFRAVEVRGGTLDEFPSTRAAFAGDPGVGRFSTALHFRATAELDLRDDPDAPARGLFLRLHGEGVAEGWGSDYSAWGWGFEARGYVEVVPWFGVAVRGLVSVSDGGADQPFYERSALGGETDLRAFPEGRFVAEGRILGQVEARLGAVEVRILGGQAGLQLVPFADVGRVFDGFRDLDRAAWQPVGGIGFRLELPPATRGRLDLGWGREGLAVFLTLGYPF